MANPETRTRALDIRLADEDTFNFGDIRTGHPEISSWMGDEFGPFLWPSEYKSLPELDANGNAVITDGSGLVFGDGLSGARPPAGGFDGGGESPADLLGPLQMTVPMDFYTW